jgi:hypothetical protein
MARLRRLLAPVTAIWLCCQLGTVTLVPVALWVSASDPHAVECTCGHDVGAMCPMHRKPAGESAPCAMQAANGPGTAVLTTLVGTAGLVPETMRTIHPHVLSERLRPSNSHAADARPVPPDPPPPRA